MEEILKELNISFFIKKEELLKRYKEIWDKTSAILLKKGLDSKPVYKERYLKSKIKFYEGKISRSFHGDKMLKKGSQCIYLSVILIDFVFRVGKNCDPQQFLLECKYVVKERELSKYINGNVETFSDDSDKEDSNEESSGVEKSNEENTVNFLK